MEKPSRRDIPMVSRIFSAPAVMMRSTLSSATTLPMLSERTTASSGILQRLTELSAMLDCEARLWTTDDLDIVHDVACRIYPNIASFVHLCGARQWQSGGEAGGAVMEHFDATGVAHFQCMTLFDSPTLTLKLQYLPANSRTITTFVHNMNAFTVALMGQCERKQINLVRSASDATDGVVAEYQAWSADATRPLEDLKRSIPNQRTFLVSKNELTMLHPMITHNEVGSSFKAITSTLLLSFEAKTVSNPSSLLQPHLRYTWNNVPSELFQPANMNGPPAHVPAPCTPARADEFADAVQKCLASQTSVFKQHEKSFYLESIYRRAMYDSLQVRCRVLDDAITARAGQVIQAQDASLVKEIGDSILVYAANNGLLNSALKLEVVTNDDEVVMWRYFMYDSPSLQLRIHLFPSGAETYIHSHKTNFISMSLFGSYIHNTWIVHDGGNDDDNDDKESENYYYSRCRNSDGTLTDNEKRKGRLEIASTFVHSVQHAYFLDNSTCHTVVVRPEAPTPTKRNTSCPPAFPGRANIGDDDVSEGVHSVDEVAGSNPMISLFCKDKVATKNPTQVLEVAKKTSTPSSFSLTTSSSAQVERSAEQELFGEEKLAILFKIQCLLQQSFGNIMGHND